VTSPRVSVVVPAYQSARYVGQTVESVLKQTYDNVEVIVADHASSDGTWEILSRYASQPNFRLLRTEAGGGAERNWNRVTDEASGKYLKLVCADDLLYPTCIAEQVAVMEADENVALAAARRDLIDSVGRVLVRARGLPKIAGKLDGLEAIRKTVRAGTNIFGEPACVLLRTDLVRKVGGWSASHPYLIDEDMYVKVLAYGDLFAIPEALAAFRISGTQWSVGLARQQARQARAFHADVRVALPGAVSALDARIGSARAVAIAVVRRTAYFAWRRRMR
jgi:glycosyltransferase involved in cell wall biosynthesis